MRLLPLLMVVLMLGACGKDGQVFQLPADEIKTALSTSGGFDLSVMPGKKLVLDRSASTDSSLIWSVRDEGNELIRVKADLQVENALATRVIIHIKGGDSPQGLEIADILDENTEIRETYKKAVAQAIAAKIEGRNIRQEEFNDALQAAIAASSGRSSSAMLRYDPAIVSAYERERAQVQSDARHDGTGRPASRSITTNRPQATNAPTVNLDRY